MSRSQLDAFVAEATVDCYGDDEQLTGLFTMREDNSAVPVYDTGSATAGAQWIEAYRRAGGQCGSAGIWGGRG
jgi:hypothetical protein